MDYAFKITTNGRRILAACIDTGSALEITRVAVGKGRIAEDADLANQHELVSYVTDASIGDRRHNQDRLYLSIHYSNISHPDVPTFYLSEFMAYAKDPDTGRETDFLYATLGDYTQAVPQYTPDYPPVSYTFPLTLVLSDEANVYIGAPAGLVTYDELVDLQSVQSLTIPMSGWQRDDNDVSGYPFYADISVERATDRSVPNITVLPESMNTIKKCGLAPFARANSGKVRVYAMLVPDAAIAASLLLLSNPPYLRSDGTPGDTAISAGTGLSLRNGVMSVNVREGMQVDSANRLGVNQQTVVTDEDLTDEDATEADIKDILLR